MPKPKKSQNEVSKLKSLDSTYQNQITEDSKLSYVPPDKSAKIMFPSKDLSNSQESMQTYGGTTTEDIPLNKLIPYKQVIFKPYTGLRLQRMIESIRENGIWDPIIVRPIDDNYYEILSGHNRAEAAKRAELSAVPAIVKEGLSEDEALLIVTESNLLQRSFKDMLHSERAVAIYNHYASIKNQGKRTDLIKDIEDIHKTNDYGDCETCIPAGTKQKSLEITGQEFALAKTSTALHR